MAAYGVASKASEAPLCNLSPLKTFQSTSPNCTTAQKFRCSLPSRHIGDCGDPPEAWHASLRAVIHGHYDPQSSSKGSEAFSTNVRNFEGCFRRKHDAGVEVSAASGDAKVEILSSGEENGVLAARSGHACKRLCQGFEALSSGGHRPIHINEVSAPLRLLSNFKLSSRLKHRAFRSCRERPETKG